MQWQKIGVIMTETETVRKWWEEYRTKIKSAPTKEKVLKEGILPARLQISIHGAQNNCTTHSWKAS